jgi:arylsulfatase A-like enzyme
MCHMPLRFYRQFAHEGEACSPMIAHWPNGTDARGGISKFAYDLTPKSIELSGVETPVISLAKPLSDRRRFPNFSV